MDITASTALDTQGRAGAFTRAQKLATMRQCPMGVWEHVGSYGHPSGDVPARGTYTVRPLDSHDPGAVWALVGTVDPEPTEGGL